MGDTAFLNWIPIIVQDRQSHETEIERVTRCPDDAGDAGGFQIQFRDRSRVVAITQFWQISFWRGEPGFLDIVVNHFHDLCLELVNLGKALCEVWREHDPVILRVLQVTQEHHTIAGKLM